MSIEQGVATRPALFIESAPSSPPTSDPWRSFGRATTLIFPMRRLGAITDQRGCTVGMCTAKADDLTIVDDDGVLLELRQMCSGRGFRAKLWKELTDGQGRLIGRDFARGCSWKDAADAELVDVKTSWREGKFVLSGADGGRELAQACYRRNPAANIRSMLWPRETVIEFAPDTSEVCRAIAVAVAWLRWRTRYDD